ncbi:uncharacterized protein [Lolium perenne]|jgi:hypothetical protein|uniref:uncharacterized protein n=1 Tax=Lolium perenne TaxID=4522 RepID=UPI0021EAB43E|nr:uncharacterized protein At3g27210-like [Lolium perenne]
MGSCASVHKDDVGTPQKLLPKEGAVDGKGGAAVGDVLVDLKRKIEEGQAGFGHSRSPDSGSKDEMFFESRGWLDSDCEDDFHSVNGDFTPSRGSTPNYQPRANTVMSNVFLPNNEQGPNEHDSKSSEPSPTGRRKLSELLQEAMQNAHKENTDTATGEPDSSKQQPQPVDAAEKPVSESSTGCSTEPTPAREARIRKERSWYTGHCCLPTFVHSMTLEEDEGRQKMGPGPVAV